MQLSHTCSNKPFITVLLSCTPHMPSCVNFGPILLSLKEGHKGWLILPLHMWSRETQEPGPSRSAGSLLHLQRPDLSYMTPATHWVCARPRQGPPLGCPVCIQYWGVRHTWTWQPSAICAVTRLCSLSGFNAVVASATQHSLKCMTFQVLQRHEKVCYQTPSFVLLPKALLEEP